MHSSIILCSLLILATATDADPCETSQLLPYMRTVLDPAGSCSASSNAAFACNSTSSNPAVAWTASASDTAPYIEYNFTREMYVSKIRLAGLAGAYVENFTVSFLVRMGGSLLFYPILENPQDSASPVKMFTNEGGSDSTFGEVTLCPRIRTMVIRIHPKTWVGTVPTIRADLRGCNTHSSCTSCQGSCQCPWGYGNNYCSYWNMPPIDCEDHSARGNPTETDFFHPPGISSFRGNCDNYYFMGGGWTVLLSRTDDGRDFERPWSDYKNGFGKIYNKASRWLGLEKAHQLTGGQYNSYQALVYTETIDGDYGIALYDKFSVGDEASKYQLTIGNYILGLSSMGDSFTQMNGYKFYTKDADSPQNCSNVNSGGWWYASSGACIPANTNKLTGIYGKHQSGRGIHWLTWKGLSESMLTTRLLVRRSPLDWMSPHERPRIPQDQTDCYDVMKLNTWAQSGTHSIYSPLFNYNSYSNYESLFCDLSVHDGGWLLLQKRKNTSSTSFAQPYSSYVNGFGNRYDIENGYWMGLQKMYAVTKMTRDLFGFDLMIVLEDEFGEYSSQLYTGLTIGDSASGYMLTAEETDSSMLESAGDAMSLQFGVPFVASDSLAGQACPATSAAGGWWFNGATCDDANLNGDFASNNANETVVWSSLPRNIVSTTMLMRPTLKNKPLDCADIYAINNQAPSGNYYIFPLEMRAIMVYCDFDLNIPGYGIGWTAVQRHSDPDYTFHRGFHEYGNGFSSGNQTWIGNNYLYQKSRRLSLSIMFRVRHNSNGSWYRAVYPSVKWDAWHRKFRMTLSPYDPAASTVDGSLMTAYHQYDFSTFDQPAYPCISSLQSSGWWIGPNCETPINLNGVLGYSGSEPGVGATWLNVHDNDSIGALETEIYIKRRHIADTITQMGYSVDYPNMLVDDYLVSSHAIYKVDCALGSYINDYYSTSHFVLRHPWITGLFVWSVHPCNNFDDYTADCAYWQRVGLPAERTFSRPRSDLQTSQEVSFTTYCDNEFRGGGWTLVLRRVDGSFSFNRPASDFENALGDPAGNFWIGLRALRGLTAIGNYTLIIEMRQGNQYGFIQQSNFWVRDNASIWDHTWSTTLASTISNSQLSIARFMDDPCAGGPWWTTNCAAPDNVNLMGTYGQQADPRKNIYYKSFYINSSYALSWVEMKIRRTSNNFTSWIKANNFYCNYGPVLIAQTNSSDQCKAFADAQESPYKTAMYFADNATCHIRKDSCKAGEGSTLSVVESFFRNDVDSSPNRHCGPAPIMKNADYVIVGMPSTFQVSYTCKEGYRNALNLTSSSTVLTCDEASMRWMGTWIDCKPFCGELNNLAANNAYVTRYTRTNATSAVFTTACFEGFDIEYGDVHRTCASPYTAFTGIDIMCTNRCRSDDLLSKLDYWNGILTASSGRAELANGNKDMFWKPLPTDINPYVQVNFGKEMAVSVIKIAGYGDSGTTSYSVRFALRHRGMSWQFYPVLTDMANPFSPLLIIPGARSGDYLDWMPYAFCPVIRTQMIRIHPETWMGTVPTLRLLVKGCPNHHGCHTCCKSAADCSCRCALGYDDDKSCSALSIPPMDCEEIAARNPAATSGVYTIYPPGVGNTPLSVYCDMERLGGGWTVLQARVDGSQDFYLDWNAYKAGFGNLSANFWLGLDNMHMLTSSKYYSFNALVYMETANNDAAFAYYDRFSVDNEAAKYKLSVGNYNGNAGDALNDSNGIKFSTKDADNDIRATGNCAIISNGAGWFADCGSCNINGIYGATANGIFWQPYRGLNESMKNLRVMIRRSPINYVIPGLRPSNAWYPTDCEDIKNNNSLATSGLYTIYPANANPVQVFCEMSLMGGGWTVFQRRVDATQDFYQNWTAYKTGFGDLTKNFWLGNDNIHKLTSLNQYSLAIQLEANDGVQATVTYNHFRIDDELRNYRIYVEGFNGLPEIGDSLAGHNGFQFSTKDVDNDGWSLSCAQSGKGGWWYSSCIYSNLNAVYGSPNIEGLNWYTWKGYNESMKSTVMMLRRFSKPPRTENPTDCQDILDGRPGSVSGVYTIHVPDDDESLQPLSVYCEMAALGGGWTVFQANVDNSANFKSRSTVEYDEGFGSPESSYWMGLRWLKRFGGQLNIRYDMAISLEDEDGNRRTTMYKRFQSYDWNGDDSANIGYEEYVYNDIESADHALEGSSFQTADRYNDSCSLTGSAPWWKYYNEYEDRCGSSNLNGEIGATDYERSIYWRPWKGWLKSARMLLRPTRRKPYDCADHAMIDFWNSEGTRWIYPPGMKPFRALCSSNNYNLQQRFGRGWTVIRNQQASGQSLPTMSWHQYQYGFGTPEDNEGFYYMGNEHIHQLTKSGAYALVIAYHSSGGDAIYNYYDNFAITSESDGYRLILGGYSPDGNMNNMFSDISDRLQPHIGQSFSTHDNGTSPHCVSINQNYAWWYPPGNCHFFGSNFPTDGGELVYLGEMAIKRKAPSPIFDCEDVYQKIPGAATSFYYLRDMAQYDERWVFCDMDYRIASHPWDTPGWSALSRRLSNSYSFRHHISTYQYGFSNMGNSQTNATSDYYLGSNFLQRRVEEGAQMLMLKMLGPDETEYRAFYDDFEIKPDSSLNWTRYISELSNTPDDSMEAHRLMPFQAPYNNYYYSNTETPCNAYNREAGWWFAMNDTVCADTQPAFLMGIINETNPDKFLKYESISDTESLLSAEMYLKRKSPRTFTLANAALVHQGFSVGRQHCPRFTKQASGHQLRIAITGMQGFFSNFDCMSYKPKDCSYYQSLDNSTKSGEAVISIETAFSEYKSYCDHDTMGGGWTVIQRRVDNSTSFNRNMTEYEQGFGDPIGNFWLGLKAIQELTETQQYELLVEVRTLDTYAFAWYSSFALERPSYRLFIDGYSIHSSAGDSLSYVNGSIFVVDTCGTGGWWLPRDCPEHSYPFGGRKRRAAGSEPIQSNLNAAYDRNDTAHDYMYWATFDYNDYSQNAVNFVWTEMKIRTKQMRPKFLTAPNYEAMIGEPLSSENVSSAEQCQHRCSSHYPCLAAVWNFASFECFASNGSVGFNTGNPNDQVNTYVPVGKPGDWSDKCGLPPQMNNTYVNITIGVDHFNVTYQCIPGLININPLVDGQETTLRCQDDGIGKWQGGWLNCAEACGTIPDATASNATMVSFNVEKGIANYTFACLKGTLYESGDYFVTCQPPYRNFTGRLLQCTATPCPLPPTVANATNSSVALDGYWSRVVNQTIEYTCLSGYVALNSSGAVNQSTTCMDDGQWFPDVFDCIADCQPIGGCSNGGSCVLPNTCSCLAGWISANCSEADCSSIGTCLNGGICTAPSVCSCADGWFSANCSKANCSSIGECQNGGSCTAPNNCTCMPGWFGTNCMLPDCSSVGGCQNDGNCTAPDTCSCPLGWIGDDCATPDCGGCLNGGTCVEPFNCSCNQFWNGSRCEIPIGSGAINITLPADELTLPDPANLSDAALVLKSAELTSAVASIAKAISSTDDNGAVVVEAAVSFMSSVKTLLARYATLADSMPVDALENLANTYAAASDAVMASALESETTSQSAVVAVVDAPAKCKAAPKSDVEMVDPEAAASVAKPSAEQSNKLLTDFGSSVQSLIELFKMMLKKGKDFTYSGRFFSGVIKGVPLDKLPGLSLESTLAVVSFPESEDPFEMLQDTPSGMSATSLVTVVLMSYTVNVIDPSKTFNLPTVSMNIYYQNDIPLKLNRRKPYLVTGRPAGSKAKSLGGQKKEAQCDVSEISCDPAENGDSLSSLVTFPVNVKSGDFFITFPPEEIDYTAYIALNSTPTPNNLHWQVQVDSNGASVVAANKTIGKINLEFKDKQSDMRAVIRKSVLIAFLGTKSLDTPLTLYVNMKRNLSSFGPLDELPASICEMQRCSGYHIRVANAGSKSENARRKRETEDEDADSFELEPNSTETSVTFKSSYFGDFGADLAIMPNTIEFSDVFANFSQLLADNYAVFAFQIAIVLFFLLAIGFSVHFDKQDLREWAFLPLRSNQQDDEFRYLVSVSHFGVKRYDLIPKIYMKVYGDLQNTKWRFLDDGTRKNFQGKLPANFMLSTFVPIGKLDACEVAIGTFKRENPGEKTFEMTIDKITIVDVQSAEKYVFLAKKKLKAGQSCLFELAKEDDIKGFRYLVSSHSRTGLPESHPWLSITRRPLPSNWTRTERLACVVSALFMAMLVNAMFYGKEASAPRVGISIAGVFRISWFTIWTSMFGAVIVIPPTAIMAFIFKRVKRRSAEKSQWTTIFNLKIEPEHLDDDPNQKKKKTFQLPWGCVVIGWILVAAAVGVSSFMVIMYSLSWGREKSLQWLSGMIMHIVQDIIVIQTIKVMLFSVFNSTLLSLPDDGLGVGKQIYAPSPEKPKTELFKRLRNVIAGIFHHFIYVAAFAAVIGTTLNFYSYRQVRDVKSLVNIPEMKPLEGTVNYTTIYDWLDKKLLPGFLLGNQLINGFNFQKRSFYRVPNHDVALMGPIRLRQQRVTKAPCYLEGAIVKALVEKPAKWLITNETAPCQRNYISMTGLGDNSEKRLFNMSWTTFADESSVNVSDNSFHPWIYRETSGPPYTGWQGDYKSGGYFVDLPIQITKAKAVVASLRSARWIDNSTGVLFVDFVLYNPQVNIFVAVKVVFESLSAGGMTYHMRLSPLNLYQYSGASSFLAFALQGLWLITLISHFVKILIQMKKQGFKKFRSDGWNILNFLQILMSFGIVALFAARIYVIINTVSRFQTDRTTFLDLDLLAGWEELMFGMYGLAFFLTMLLFFRHLQANKHWAMFLGTLSRGKSEIGSFIIVFVIITMMFSIFGYLSLSDTCVEFRSFSASVMTLVQNIIGVSGSLMSLSFTSRFIMVFCLAYSTIVMFLAVNVFMTIISVTYGTVADNVEEHTNWDVDLADYISDEWSKILNKEAPKACEKPTRRQKPTLTNVLKRLDGFVDRSLTKEMVKTHQHDKFIKTWQDQLSNKYNVGRAMRPPTTNMFGLNYSWTGGNSSGGSMPNIQPMAVNNFSNGNHYLPVPASMMAMSNGNRRHSFNHAAVAGDLDVNVIYPIGH